LGDGLGRGPLALGIAVGAHSSPHRLAAPAGGMPRWIGPVVALLPNDIGARPHRRIRRPGGMSPRPASKRRTMGRAWAMLLGGAWRRRRRRTSVGGSVAGWHCATTDAAIGRAGRCAPSATLDACSAKLEPTPL